MTPKPKLIVALDGMNQQNVIDLIEKIDSFPELGEFKNRIIFKVNDLLTLKGLEGIFEIFKNRGFHLMLDPKWHDIPATVGNNFKQFKNVPGLGALVDYVTVHASGGKKMLEGVKDSTGKVTGGAVWTRDSLPENDGKEMKILAISVLTSLERQDTKRIFRKGVVQAVLDFAKLAIESGVDGLVCSPLEAKIIRKVYGNKLILVTPGIRFAGSDTQDQQRVDTPAKAIENGSTDLVMGRDIIRKKIGERGEEISSEDVKNAILKFFQEIDGINPVDPTDIQDDEKLLQLIFTGEWLDIAKHIGALYLRPENGAFVRLASKLVSNGYVNIAAFERYPEIMNRASMDIGEKLSGLGVSPDYIMGAEKGSMRFSSHLGDYVGCNSIYAEKSGPDLKEMSLDRHDIDLTGKSIVLCEDVITKASTVEKMITLVESRGGKVSGICCIANRSGKDEYNGIPLISCFVPPTFDLYYDASTPQEKRENYPELSSGSEVVEKPKNHWNELVASMRK